MTCSCLIENHLTGFPLTICLEHVFERFHLTCFCLMLSTSPVLAKKYSLNRTFSNVCTYPVFA